MDKKNKNILFVYQSAFSQTGGIQTFNKHFIRALEYIKRDAKYFIKLVSIYDNKDDIKTNLSFETLNKSKWNAINYIIKNSKKYDIFIFAHINLAPLAIIVYLLNPNAKIIFCTHGIEVWKKLPKYTEWIMNRSIILTVSNYSKNKLKIYNNKLKNIIIFPNCIQINKNNKKFFNPYNEREFNLLSVTRLSVSEKLKGIDYVLKSIPEILKKIPNLKYTIIGQGDDIKRLKKITEELNISQYVSFLGFVENLDPYYKYCDVFILPSKKEGFGIVYLEAMQYKKPCIACDEGGQTDVILDNKTGYLCKYGDIECLANKIIDLYENKEKRIRFGENAYLYLIENFTFEKFKNNLLTILQEA